MTERLCVFKIFYVKYFRKDIIKVQVVGSLYIKKHKNTCYISELGSPTKYVRQRSDSSEQADEMNSDISHLNVIKAL